MIDDHFTPGISAAVVSAANTGNLHYSNGLCKEKIVKIVDSLGGSFWPIEKPKKVPSYIKVLVVAVYTEPIIRRAGKTYSWNMKAGNE